MIINLLDHASMTLEGEAVIFALFPNLVIFFP